MEAKQSNNDDISGSRHLQGRHISTPYRWVFPYCWTTYQLGHFILLYVPYNPFPHSMIDNSDYLCLMWENSEWEAKDREPAVW